jgi:hypothetical protein
MTGLKKCPTMNMVRLLKSRGVLLKSVGEIKTLKKPLQEDCQFIRLKGIILMKKERVALFENNEQTCFSARKVCLISPYFKHL